MGIRTSTYKFHGDRVHPITHFEGWGNRGKSLELPLKAYRKGPWRIHLWPCRKWGSWSGACLWIWKPKPQHRFKIQIQTSTSVRMEYEGPGLPSCLKTKQKSRQKYMKPVFKTLDVKHWRTISRNNRKQMRWVLWSTQCTDLREIPGCGTGRGPRQSLEDSLCWGGRSKGLGRPRQLELAGQSDRSKGAAPRENSWDLEMVFLKYSGGYDQHMCLRKCPKAGERTTWKDWQE